MSLQQCHECKKDVSSEAKLCPNCGAPIKKSTSMTAKIIAGFFLFFLLLVIISLISGPSTKTPSTPPAVSDSSTPTQTSPPTGGVVQTSTDEQIYRELEICMNRAKPYYADNKLEYQRMSAECMLKLKKYDKKQAARVFQMYLDLN